MALEPEQPGSDLSKRINAVLRCEAPVFSPFSWVELCVSRVTTLTDQLDRPCLAHWDPAEMQIGEWSCDILARKLTKPRRLTEARACRRLREGRPVYQQSFVVRQGSQQEMHMLPYFVEDRTPQADSYVDYLLRVHKAVLTGK